MMIVLQSNIFQNSLHKQNKNIPKKEVLDLLESAVYWLDLILLDDHIFTTQSHQDRFPNGKLNHAEEILSK